MMNHFASFIQKEECKRPLDWISSRQDDLVQMVQAWSRVNSGSHNLDGLSAMIDLVSNFAAPLNANLKLIPLDHTPSVNADGDVVQGQNGAILHLSKRPEANRRLLLTGHLDTVFPLDSHFQECHWLDSETLNGPGVADMKGGILVMLTALMALEQSPYADSVGWDVLLSPDEETGSLASAPVLMEYAKRASMGLTYEPAMPDGTMAGKRKGSGNYTLVVRGKAAHAGRDFYSGSNAVVALSKLIGQLADLSGQREGLTVNPAVITGGVAPNVVPDLAQCRFNVRLEKMADELWFTDKLNALVNEASTQDGVDVSLHGGINRPPKEITPQNQRMMDLIQACGQQLDISVNYMATGGCCEGNNLAAAGLPNVDTLGVVGGNIHSDQEYVDVSSFVPRTQLSALIMMAFGNGLFDSVFSEKE